LELHLKSLLDEYLQ